MSPPPPTTQTTHKHARQSAFAAFTLLECPDWMDDRRLRFVVFFFLMRPQRHVTPGILAILTPSSSQCDPPPPPPPPTPFFYVSHNTSISTIRHISSNSDWFTHLAVTFLTVASEISHLVGCTTEQNGEEHTHTHTQLTRET